MERTKRSDEESDGLAERRAAGARRASGWNGLVGRAGGLVSGAARSVRGWGVLGCAGVVCGLVAGFVVGVVGGLAVWWLATGAQ